ncbi:MAG TPA: HNH endonuclease signature motif containing protein [Chthoniobacterales bacterium]
MKLLLTFLLGFLIFSGNARAQNALLPNPKLTPGRVAERDKDRAGVTVAMERKVFARYRLPWASRAEFKVDHLIPVALGGADTLDNLWPQKIRAKPYGADRKELLAEVLLQKVRAGKMTLAQAQEEIRRDWIDAFIDHLGMVFLRPGNLMAD